jgi:hypothetical protein
MPIPGYLTSLLFFGWGMYYFIRETNFKKLKTTWKNFFKGIMFMIFAVVTNKFISLGEGGNVDIDKLDTFLAMPVLIFTIIRIAKIVNKKVGGKEERRSE